jgi:hypothetical protein
MPAEQRTTKRSRVAEMQYGKLGERNVLELVVPHGTQMKEIGRIQELVLREALGKLPRGCQSCLSGEHFIIREQLENVVRVDLELGQVIGP